MDILTITPNTDYNNQVKPNCYTNIVHIKHGIQIHDEKNDSISEFFQI